VPLIKQEVNSSAFAAQAEGTKWLFHLHKVLSASLFIAHLIHQDAISVLVHCSDGYASSLSSSSWASSSSPSSSVKGNGPWTDLIPQPRDDRKHVLPRTSLRMPAYVFPPRPRPCPARWDRTPQLTGTAELLLDPYYRTLKGFQVRTTADA
jgi:hypothetical protein